MRKKLGQHFLHDEEALRQIADSLEIKSTDVIVEIGPGHGELTKYLIEAGPKKVIAIEKDKDLASELRKSMQYVVYSGKLAVIDDDILKAFPSLHTTYDMLNTPYKLVGNIPYYITGFLLRGLQQLENKPTLIVLTIQKEVALRICAEPLRRRQGFGGQAKMNLLAASVQFWAEPEIIGFIEKDKFNPQPKVDSAIIKLFPKKPTGNEEDYYRLIKLLFKQPRKTVLNNLSTGTKKTKQDLLMALEKLGIDSSLRPQDLNMKELNKLSNVF